MVEMYKHVNNAFINSYWEARLPSNYQKPGQNATPNEVMGFIKDKYLHKKWAATQDKTDPATLYWHDRKKFEKLKKSYIKGETVEEDEEEESEDEEERK